MELGGYATRNAVKFVQMFYLITFVYNAPMDSKKQQLLAALREQPYISQQELAQRLGLSRSAVAGHIAALTREGQILGRAYVLAGPRPIVCLGGANIDRKLRSLAPLAMGSSNPAQQLETPGGVARNVAENLARLGLEAALISVVGQDAAGRSLLEQAAQAGIRLDGVLREPDLPTGSYTAVLDAGGEMVLALAQMEATERLTPEALRRSAPQRAQARLLMADLNLAADSLALLLDEARRSGQPLVLVAVSEPKMARLPESLDGLACLVLNRGELQALAGRPLGSDKALDQALATLHRRGVAQIVLTLGERGVRYSLAGGSVQSLAAEPVAVREVTGAGDAFAAGLCAALAEAPDELGRACRLGLRLASLTLQAESSVSPDLSPALWSAWTTETTLETH